MSLPEVFTQQERLLTVDANLSKLLEGLLRSGIKNQGLSKMNHISARILIDTR